MAPLNRSVKEGVILAVDWQTKKFDATLSFASGQFHAFASPMMPWLTKGSTEVLMLGLVVAALTGCTRAVQAWPPSLPTGATVTVRFNQPRVIVFHDAGKSDSVTAVKALRGPVIRVNRDTLVIVVSKEWNAATEESRLAKREVQVPLDQATVVTAREIDGWKFAYALLAGAVLIYVGVLVSGS